MERWNNAKNERAENARIDAFLAEVIEVSKRHGLSISHEDAHGAFEVTDYSDKASEWLMDAHDDTRNA